MRRTDTVREDLSLSVEKSNSLFLFTVSFYGQIVLYDSSILHNLWNSCLQYRQEVILAKNIPHFLSSFATRFRPRITPRMYYFRDECKVVYSSSFFCVIFRSSVLFYLFCSTYVVFFCFLFLPFLLCNFHLFLATLFVLFNFVNVVFFCIVFFFISFFFFLFHFHRLLPYFLAKNELCIYF